MDTLETLQKQLELLFASYLQLSEDHQKTAMDMTLVVQRQMLRAHSGQRKKIVELGSTKRKRTSDAEKSRSKLVRKSNAVSPQAPIKPVQTTKNNELRRT